MPRKAGKVPAYCHHKASGQAVVRVDGQDRYLGPYGSDDSYQKYERLIAEWRGNRQTENVKRQRTAVHRKFDLTVSQVLYHYRDFARSYYVKDGKPTQELADMKYALRPLRKLYGQMLIRDFGPLALAAVQQSMIDDDLSRGVINHRINRIRRFFKWAVSKELVPADVHAALTSVPGLKYNRSEARETEPVKPVPNDWIDATLPYLLPPVAAMVATQRLTGMRPCEVVILRACDMDMSGTVWIYEPSTHKNLWRGHRRSVPIGPQAQKILRPFLTLNTDAYLFSPRDAMAWQNAQRRSSRKTPLTPSQRKRKPLKSPKRAKRDRYDTASYRRAITYAIKQANRQRKPDEQIGHWFPLQIRHLRATEVRKVFGIEAAQVSLGHAHANVTEVYAERNLDLAIEVAQKTG